MDIKHRICISPKRDVKVWKKLQKLGIEMKETGDGKIVQLFYFDIYECSSNWPMVKEIVSSNNIPTTSHTIFTKDEIQSAKWVLVAPDFIHGYPMPDIDGSWREISFNAGEECPVCGIGREQVAPIRLNGEPKMGRNHFIAVNWTFDLFAQPDVIEAMFQNKISGFEEMDVIHYKSMEPLNTVKQLRFIHELSGGIIDEYLTKELPECGHIKYLGLTRGMYRFSSDAFDEAPDLVRSHQWFGSGHQASQLVLASSAFVELYLRSKWKGLYLAPIELL